MNLAWLWREPVLPSTGVHLHYCQLHDHRWECRVARCLRHDAADCWRRWLATKESA